LINIKNKFNECFRRCHIRHINPQNKDQERVKKIDREYVKYLNYSNVEFPVKINDYIKIEKQNNINVNVFGYDNKQPLPIYIRKEKFNDHLNLLILPSLHSQTHSRLRHGRVGQPGPRYVIFTLLQQSGQEIHQVTSYMRQSRTRKPQKPLVRKNRDRVTAVAPPLGF